MNRYEGETKITLYDKEYVMKVNMRFIASFSSETGKDFNAAALKAMNAYEKSRTEGLGLSETAEKMAEAVPMDIAAWAFYLAAHESDKCVTFGEIQEAVLLEGVTARPSNRVKDKVTLSYPIKFMQLATHALIGVFSEKKL